MLLSIKLKILDLNPIVKEGKHGRDKKKKKWLLLDPKKLELLFS